ncbi:hypothetical protein [Mangrovimonas aestuarii]|uniref:hypothetical protein n=1 Tax=Mangrovimonas aestuarii TaxID=3018443 RepID=UPI0023791327|nr:hypothetical protein [Mangrovimonas aestuarii]
MKTIIPYKCITLFLVALLTLQSQAMFAGDKHEKSKTIKKEFNVNKNALVSIDNSYGNLDVITWSENRVVFEITITTSGNNLDKVEQKLEDITVDFTASTNEVSAKTVFNKDKSFWNWGNSNVNMKINYIVKMPITNGVNLKNDYGNINLAKLEGQATISCDYGKITTKELMAENNIIKFDYTNNCYFEFINSGKINADYSSYTVAKTKGLNITADYTKSNIEVAENIVFNCDYGAISIDQVNNLKGNGDYLTTKIGDVYQALDLDADYGAIKIERLHKNVSTVRIKSDYTGIKVGCSPDYNFNFEIDLEYASLKELDNFNFTTTKKDHTDKYYSGYSGNQNSGNMIKIESDYGSVSFFRN